MTKEKKNNSAPTIIQFSSLGIQMAAIIGALGYLGYFLDQKIKLSQQYFTLAGLILGVIVSIVYVIRALKKME